MNVLHITPEAPGEMSGGALVVLQTTSALSSLFEKVDYIGPLIQCDKIKEKYNKVIELSKSNTWIELLFTFICGHTNRSYVAWSKLKVQFDKYDLIFLEFTKQDYVIKSIRDKNPSIPIIVRIHNIEQDFAKVDYRTNPSWIRYFVYKTSRRKEKYIMKQADRLIALTENDMKRASILYKLDRNKIDIIPVCIKSGIGEKSFTVVQDNEKKIKCMITGSLWYGPNVEGIYWFISNVYDRVKEMCILTIAGFHPNEKMISLCEEKGIRLIDSPDNMSIYYESNELIIVPIFVGAGMKVKIAEALSYGKPVITTSYGAIGYDTVQYDSILIGDTSEEFINNIALYYQLNRKEKQLLSKNAYSLYERFYSLDANTDYYKESIYRLKQS